MNQTARSLRKPKDEWEESAKTQRYPVSEEDIAEVVSMMTGIPVKRVAQSESSKTVGMVQDCAVVVGQDEAITKWCGRFNATG